MIYDRNLSTHTYNDVLAKDLVSRIKNNYVNIFNNLKNKFIKV